RARPPRRQVRGDVPRHAEGASQDEGDAQEEMTHSSSPPPPLTPSPPQAFSWAVFLGMSWTWCIGMFLPVLLVRDYGPWAWGAFAIPHVVGAAAMGWVLSTGASDDIARNHSFWVKAFSWVTAAFQIFFAFWIFQ